MNVEGRDEKCGKGVRVGILQGDASPGGHAVLAIHKGAVHTPHACPLMSGGACVQMEMSWLRIHRCYELICLPLQAGAGTHMGDTKACVISVPCTPSLKPSSLASERQPERTEWDETGP